MLIKSDLICDEIYEITNSLIIVDVNKKDLTRAISSWLEKNNYHQMLQNWPLFLKTEGLGKHTFKVIAEIKFICKQC